MRFSVIVLFCHIAPVVHMVPQDAHLLKSRLSLGASTHGVNAYSLTDGGRGDVDWIELFPIRFTDNGLVWDLQIVMQWYIMRSPLPQWNPNQAQIYILHDR